MEARLWRIVATAASTDDGLRRLGEALSEGQREPVRIVLMAPGVRDGRDPEPLLEWIGARPWRWSDDLRSLPEECQGQDAPGVLGLVVGEDPRGAAVASGLTERAGADAAAVLGEVLRALLESESRRSASTGAAESRAGARVGRSSGFGAIVGAGAGLAPVLRRVEMVAPQDVPVLLLGETGSGKEVIARAVHDRSRRAGGPFVRVNCGAIPRDLIDSELFGHEKGSFTGAIDRRHGWFERAHGGTLLLDEIGELPLDAQVRLLRILQDGSLTRVGGARPVVVDVRIVGATHRDLPAMVDARAFREDLWYRIATFPIRIPPLRERQGDIADLARHFVHKAAVRFGLAEPALDASALDLLVAYPWPGNVRELGTVIDRAMILGEGHRLEVAQALGIGERGRSMAAAGAGAPAAPIPADSGPAGEEPQDGGTLDDAVRRRIEAALRKTHGRVDGPFGAARALGINPNTLHSRMRKLGIVRARFRGDGR